MGCHTWFYKKSELKIEKARENLINRLKTGIDFDKLIIEFYTVVDLPHSEIFSGENQDFHYTSEKIFKIGEKIFGDDVYLEFLESYPEWDIELCTKRIKIYERQIRMIEKGLCNCAVYKRMNGFFVNGNYYVDSNEFHDVFRKYGYPETILTSYDETIKYIEDKKNECSTYEYTHIRLKEFWDKYPDGIITFG